MFLYNATPTTEIYTLSLHDALPISGRKGEPALFIRRLNRASGGGRQDGPVVAEQLEPVPRRRVVACRDLNSASRAQITHRQPDSRRWNNAEVVHLATRPHEAREHGMPHDQPARPAVARQHDAFALKRRSQSRREPQRRLGCQALADDPADAGDADDQFGHDDSERVTARHLRPAPNLEPHRLDTNV